MRVAPLRWAARSGLVKERAGTVFTTFIRFFHSLYEVYISDYQMYIEKHEKRNTLLIRINLYLPDYQIYLYGYLYGYIWQETTKV